MFLRKINPNLNLSLKESDFTEAYPLQVETFSPIKSGIDLIISGEHQSGKSTTIVLNVIQRLIEPFEQSPRALIIVPDKEKVAEMVETFKNLNKYNKLRVYSVHDQSDIDNDKNLISIGIDVLIGTPKKLGELFSGAGFDINRLKMFIVDDLELVLKNRAEPIITRLSFSIEKTQRIFVTTVITNKVEDLAEKLMNHPEYIEL